MEKLVRKVNDKCKRRKLPLQTLREGLLIYVHGPTDAVSLVILDERKSKTNIVDGKKYVGKDVEKQEAKSCFRE